MSTHVLAQFEGDKEQFPAYPLRKSTNRIAASKEHSSMHCLLTWNPDGCSVPNCKLDPLYESGPILYHERKWSRADADTKHMSMVYPVNRE